MKYNNKNVSILYFNISEYSDLLEINLYNDKNKIESPKI